MQIVAVVPAFENLPPHRDTVRVELPHPAHNAHEYEDIGIGLTFGLQPGSSRASGAPSSVTC
jgi:hypothetical protein